jgi:MFS family permease
MRYKYLLEKFQHVGIYHLILAIVTHFSMIMSFYIVISLANERKPPTMLCKENSSINGEFFICRQDDFCSGKFETMIDNEDSIKNWTFRYQLYCEREFYFRYLTSSVFLFAIFSALFMSILADKIGRKFSFKIEALGSLLSFIILYYEQNLFMIFLGVILNEMCSHIFNTSTLYCYEYFPSKYYIIMMTAQNISYGLIGLLSAIYADTYKDLQLILLIMIVFGIIVSIFALFFLTESPDWLINLYKHSKNLKTQEKYLEKLKNEFIYLTEFNHFYSPQKIQEELDNYKQAEFHLEPLHKCDDEENLNEHTFEEEKEHFFSYLSNNLKLPKFRRHFLLGIFLWIVNQVIFYCTLTNLSVLENSISNVSVLFFVSHILANLFVGIFSTFFGLKSSIYIFSWVTTAFLIGLIITYYNPPETIVLMILFFCFNFFGTFVGDAIYMFIPQLFEPNIRSTACSYAKVPAKILLVIAPFFLGQSPIILYYVFLILSVSAPIVMFFLI